MKVRILSVLFLLFTIRLLVIGASSKLLSYCFLLLFLGAVFAYFLCSREVANRFINSGIFRLFLLFFFLCLMGSIVAFYNSLPLGQTLAALIKIFLILSVILLAFICGQSTTPLIYMRMLFLILFTHVLLGVGLRP